MQKRVRTILNQRVSQSYHESRNEWNDDKFAAHERNQGIRYYDYRPKASLAPKELRNLTVRVSRQDPLTSALHHSAATLLVLFSPKPSPQHVIRKAIPHELTVLAACSTLSYQIYANQLRSDSDEYVELHEQEAYFIPRVKITRDHLQPMYDPLLYPQEVAVVIMSDVRDSLHPDELSRQLWTKLSTPLNIIAVEKEQIRNVVFGPLGSLSGQEEALASAIAGVRKSYNRVFDSITFTADTLSTFTFLSIWLASETLKPVSD